MSKRPAPEDEDASNSISAAEECTEKRTLAELPSKRFYRQRAHCNPWSDHTLDYPIKPEDMDWDQLYGKTTAQRDAGSLFDPVVRFVDVGCGYGGLLFKLAVHFPLIRSLGLEIRLKVCDFVQEKIRALRVNQPGEYENIACIRTNAMKFLPNFFHKGQVQKMFFLYPDPHFKRVKHKWRIISPTLLDIYAYLLPPAGRLYAATDVADLAQWILECLSRHPLFELHCCVHLKPSTDGKSLRICHSCELDIDDEKLAKNEETFEKFADEDPVMCLFRQGSTDESLKATREGRGTTVLVFKRKENPPW
ncbi:unnamed protein product [Calicophoron daubneyi]|uniref:tRNA (guanine-N(7)-)-methyltransferase n=1 Tax=Calicophoron daubneyi TaxID=300641 RepID=A0AAV2TSM1_CALDB